MRYWYSGSALAFQAGDAGSSPAYRSTPRHVTNFSFTCILDEAPGRLREDKRVQFYGEVDQLAESRDFSKIEH